MDYEHLNLTEQRQLIEGSLKEFEAKHLQACINIAANKGIPGSQSVIADLTKQRDALALGIRNLRREYADLLAEPEPAAEPMPEDEMAAFERAQTNSIMDHVDRSMARHDPSDNGRVLAVVE